MSIQGSSALYMSTTVWEKGGIAENRWLGVPVALELDRPLVGPYFTLVGSMPYASRTTFARGRVHTGHLSFLCA